jgi:hypothetical protein
MQASTTTISSRAQKPLRGTLARCVSRVCVVCVFVCYTLWSDRVSNRVRKPFRETSARCAVRVCRVCDGVLYFVEQ